MAEESALLLPQTTKTVQGMHDDKMQVPKHSYNWKSMFRVKPNAAFLSDRESGKWFAEKLGLSDLLGYGVGCTVGAGIYSLIGVGAGIAGPGVVISFLIGAVSAILSALAYSEFAARVPVTGSAYTFAYASFGELLAWIIGWNLTLEYCISSAAIARSWGDYFYYFWTQWGHDPTWLNDISFAGTKLSPSAAALVSLCTILLLVGIKTSSTFNAIVTILNVGVLLFFIIVGSYALYPSYWYHENNSFVPFGAASLFTGAGTVFFTYLGLNMVSTLAEETKNPKKNLPRGIIGSVIITAVLTVLVSVVATGLVPFTSMMNSKAPLAFAFKERDLGWASKVVTIGALLGLTSANFTGLLGLPRIFYAMARDGLLFPFFRKIDSHINIPVVVTVITGIFTSIIAFFTTLEALAEVISIGTLIAFILVSAGVMVLQYSGGPRSYVSIPLIVGFVCSAFISATLFHHTSTDVSISLPHTLSLMSGIISITLSVVLGFMKKYNIPESFQCPQALIPLVPCVAISINMYMLAGLKSAAWIRLGVWMFIGMLIYVSFGFWNSKMRKRAVLQSL